MGSIPLHCTDVTFLDKNIKITVVHEILTFVSWTKKKNPANFFMILQGQHFKYHILLWTLSNISAITDCLVNIWAKSQNKTFFKIKLFMKCCSLRLSADLPKHSQNGPIYD